MAYLAFTDGAAGAATLDRVPPAGPPAAPVADAVGQPMVEMTVAAAPLAALNDLEWSVVGIAERDRLSTLRKAARPSRVSRLLFGERPNPRLADPRLEALRRVAVLSWHHGYTIPSAEVRGFLDAGFSAEQYELVVDRIADRRAEASARRFNR